MNLGIITYVAPDNSHGYLFRLEDLEEKTVYVVVRRNYDRESCYIKLRGEDLGLKKHQVVTYAEKVDKRGRKYAQIKSTYFRATVEESGNLFKITVLESDEALYILEARDKEFGHSISGVVKFQLSVHFRQYSTKFKFEDIITVFSKETDTNFWINKFVDLASIYSESLALFLNTTLKSIVKHLQGCLQEKFDLRKLFSKTLLRIQENCLENDYSTLICFIDNWKEQCPDFFIYSDLNQLINPNIELKTDFWASKTYTFEELFASNILEVNELIDCLIEGYYDWQMDLLLNLKSISVPSVWLQKVLFSTIPKELPSDFTSLTSIIDFANEYFPNLIPLFQKELKENRTSYEQIILWEKNLIELPSINTIRQVFSEIKNDTKTKLLNTVSSFDKISLFNSLLQNGLNNSDYYKNILEVIRKIIHDSNIFVFDLEFDGHNIKELAFTQQGKVVNATSQKNIGESSIVFKDALNNTNSFLAGHNIEKFDIPILKELIEVPENIRTVDTLFLETILSPTLKSFALDTKHHAKEDVEHTVNLLVNQVIRLIHITERQLKRIERFLDTAFFKLITQLRENITNTSVELFLKFETERNKFYISKETGKLKAEELNKAIAQKNIESAIFLSSKEFYPLLCELPNIQFIGEEKEYSRIVSENKVASLPDATLEKYLLESFIENCKSENKAPIYANIPSRIKIIISKNVSFDFITESSNFDIQSGNRFCFSPDKLIDAVVLIQDSNYPVVLIESDLMAVSQKTLLKVLDHGIFQQRFNKDSFWMCFTGGQSRVEITREDLVKLKVGNVADYFEFFWIEKTAIGTFQVWANYDFKRLLKSQLEESRIFEFSFSRDKLQQQNCKYAIPKRNSGKLSITRYNPETRYRDRYWTYQINLVKDIIYRSDKPTVLIINQGNEKQKLYDYFTSIRYYVPDFKASLIRQVNLLLNHSSKNKILIIEKKQIPKIVQSEDLNNFNFIIDSFELEEKWFIAKGSGYLAQAEKTESGLKFQYDDSQISTKKQEEDEVENSKPISSHQDIFVLLKIQKPIIDYFRWLFHSVDKKTTVWLTDSRLGDFEGLQEEWKATKKMIPIWKNNDAYEEDYKRVKIYFKSPKPKEEIKLNLEAAKEAIRHIFLKKDKITHQWYQYQHDFLNEILPAEKDILVTLPTGGGKSILFQGPALYRGSITGRLTIVVTPLKALMEDHAQTLWELNFYGSVDYINRDRKDVPLIYRRIAGGETMLLYITPERFRSKSFINALKMRLENDGGLEYIVYDEAHCVSQWGLDFRPDYLNSTNVNLALKKGSNSKFPILLFSATVSEQIYNDFQSRFDNSINRLENYTTAYNPLREHISIKFEGSEDSTDKIKKIAESLYRANFDSEKSRCLVFVRTRKQAEENVRELEGTLKEAFGERSFVGRVAYYHAGMNGEERQEIYDSYKSGEIYILLATKAFGMGMDIPNIHYVYHFGPSGTLEDYLQEVGRAGRNKEQLELAGFINNKTIDTKCFYEKEDFKRLKTLLQKSKIAWGNVVEVNKIIRQYYLKFRNFDPENEKPIILPFNILSQTSTFDDMRDTNNLLRLSLYWIEKLERIRLGFYALGQLEFSRFMKPHESTVLSEEQGKLITAIEKEWNQKEETTESISIEPTRLLIATEISNFSELLKLIFKCQKKKIFRYENELTIYPTKKKMGELRYFNKISTPHYTTFEAVYDLSNNLMGMTTEKEQKQFEGSVLEEQKKITAGEFFTEYNLPWCKKTDKNRGRIVDEKRIQKEQKDFERNKVKFAFTLTDFIPKVRHQTLITHKRGLNPRIVQVIYNGCKKKEDWQKFLKGFKNDFIILLKFITKNYIEQGDSGKKYNASQLIIDLGLEDKGTEYIENLFSFAKWLGYLHYEGGFLPMGIELYLQSQKEIRHEESDSIDKQVYDDFQATQKLRELRLLALQCLSKIKSKKEKDEFITDYFSCRHSEDIISLLELHFGEDSEEIKGFRDEALKIAVDGEEGVGGLSEEQLKVYNADKSSNIQVIAGPGSGKTHTLTLRVARLIHTENINPANILILAYNRAVVIELKERLTKLFSSLGYANIINRLKVFTFHGFCKFCLRDSIQNLDFDEWIPKFIETIENQPGIITNHLGVINYVFVDEFQDITNERLTLLKLIANPNNSYTKTYTTVIGDPNQSIYGYERVNEGGSRSPKDNYTDFASLYNPQELHLSQNYRSYPAILNMAEKVITKNEEKFGITTLVPIRQTEKKDYCEVIDSEKDKIKWIGKLKQILEEPHSEKPDEKFQQIAIMFRSNREIYRAYNKIRSANIRNIRLRIQGESEQFARIREIAWVLDFYKNAPTKLISKSLISEYKIKKEVIIQRFPNWDKYYLDFFECLLLEFYSEIEDKATHNDLIEFIEEICQKDDGQLSKIYYKHYHTVNPNERKTEVVLTTMHKVKGLEFDAVIIPPSFSNLPMKENPKSPLTPNDFKEEVEEERRLMFVAMTRARYRLAVFMWKREKALMNGNRCLFNEQITQKLGIPVQAGYDKYFISWGAKEYNFNRYFENIENNVKHGDTVSIHKIDVGYGRSAWTKWVVKSNNIQLGRLTRAPVQSTGITKISGFSVSGIYRYTYQDTLEYDEKHIDKHGNNTNYAKNWCQEAKNKGYVYIIEFSGYGKTN